MRRVSLFMYGIVQSKQWLFFISIVVVDWAASAVSPGVT